MEVKGGVVGDLRRSRGLSRGSGRRGDSERETIMNPRAISRSIWGFEAWAVRYTYANDAERRLVTHYNYNARVEGHARRRTAAGRRRRGH